MSKRRKVHNVKRKRPEREAKSQVRRKVDKGERKQARREERVMSVHEKFKEARRAFEVPIDLIRAPKQAARSMMDEEKLQALARSIKRNGLQTPIELVPDGDGFEVVFGHRRFEAMRRLGKQTVPSFVLPLHEGDVWMRRYDENSFREDVSVPDEAVFLQKMMKVNDWTQEEVGRRIGKTYGYVSQRLSVLDWDEQFLAALTDGELAFSALRELWAIQDVEMRAFYLGKAREGGISSTMAVQWRRQAQQVAAQESVEPGSVERLIVPGATMEVRMACGICGKKVMVEKLKYTPLCVECVAGIEHGGAEEG